MTWDVHECPGCGATVGVGLMSLAVTCKIDGFYYADVAPHRGWYSSREAYERGDGPIQAG
jgi:hypothetical protein